MLQILLLNEFHQLVMFLMGLGQAILLADGHGGEAGDELVLSLDDPQNPVLPAQAGQLPVEGTGDGGQLVKVALVHQLVHFAQAAAQVGNVRRGGVADDGGQGQHLQGVADGVDLLHIRDGEGTHHHAPPQHIFHQTVPLQLPQGLAQGGAADVQALGVVGFHDALACGNLAGDDGVLEHLIGDFTDGPAFHHGLEGQVGHGKTAPYLGPSGEEGIRHGRIKKSARLSTVCTLYTRIVQRVPHVKRKLADAANY